MPVLLLLETFGRERRRQHPDHTYHTNDSNHTHHR